MTALRLVGAQRVWNYAYENNSGIQRVPGEFVNNMAS